MPPKRTNFTSHELNQFGHYLSWNFEHGRDLLELSIEDTVDLYAALVASSPTDSIKTFRKQARLRETTDFFVKYGSRIGITTLFGLADAYYKACILQLPLSRLMVIQARTRQMGKMEGARPASLRLDSYWTRYVPDSKVTSAAGDISKLERSEDRELCRFMNRPVFEIAMVRRWVLETNEKAQLSFPAFRMITFASHWFDTRNEMIVHFEFMPEYEVWRLSCINYLDKYTSDCIDTEMLQEKVATMRFADAFPDILTHALLRACSSMTGRQLASYVALWGLDFAGDARVIHNEAWKKFAQRTKRKSAAWSKVVQLKINAMLNYSPRIRLLDQYGCPWKSAYTLSMLDEYIRLMKLWHNPFSFSQAF